MQSNSPQSTEADKVRKIQELYDQFHREAERLRSEIQQIIAREHHRLDQQKIETIRSKIFK